MMDMKPMAYSASTGGVQILQKSKTRNKLLMARRLT